MIFPRKRGNFAIPAHLPKRGHFFSCLYPLSKRRKVLPRRIRHFVQIKHRDNLFGFNSAQLTRPDRRSRGSTNGTNRGKDRFAKANRQDKNMNFSEKLKYICEREKINLREFSELCGIPYGAMKKYSGGFSAPKLNRIHQMTEHPRLSKYRNMLLSIEEPIETIGEDPEVLELIRQCEELGIADEAADVIRALLKHAKPK